MREKEVSSGEGESRGENPSQKLISAEKRMSS